MSAEAVCQMQHAPGTTSDYCVGTGSNNGSHLSVIDCHGCPMMVDRESSAKATTGIGTGHFPQPEIRERPEKIPGLFDNTATAQVTGIVVGN